MGNFNQVELRMAPYIIGLSTTQPPISTVTIRPAPGRSRGFVQKDACFAFFYSCGNGPQAILNWYRDQVLHLDEFYITGQISIDFAGGLIS